MVSSEGRIHTPALGSGHTATAAHSPSTACLLQRAPNTGPSGYPTLLPSLPSLCPSCLSFFLLHPSPLQLTVGAYPPPPSLSGNQQTVSDPFNFFVCFCSRPLPSFPLSPAMAENRPVPQSGINQLPSAGRELSASMFLDICFYSSSPPS